MQEFHQNNHYVSQSYLKRWSIDGHRVYGYRILVSHKNVPPWKLHSIRSVAYHTHLYTKMSKTGESDEFERWIADKFETPAEDSINKAITGQRLSQEDWNRMIRFAAAQYVRTPARLLESIERWKTQIPEIVDSTLKMLADTLSKGKNQNIPDIADTTVDNESFPAQIKIVPASEPGKSRIEVNTMAGRCLWQWEMKQILTNTIKELLKHRWYILTAFSGFKWITNDDPVICLNYNGPNKYDFGGGWGRKGCEIILPLSPRHLLYTQVGHKLTINKNLTRDLTLKFQKLFVERAHRWIFAEKPIEDIRPRIIDENIFASEQKEWQRWHADQSNEEQNYNLE